MKKSNKLNRTIRNLLYSQWFVLLIIILLIGTVTSMVNPKFLTWKNILAIVTQVASLSLLAIGATIMIGSGHFDISVGAIIGLCTCVMAMMIIKGVNELLVFFTGLIVALACCTLNGALSIILKAPSFIITMATTGIYTGIGLLMTQGVLQMITGKFRFFSATKVFGNIPIMVIFALIAYILAFILLKYTQTGRQIYAIGANQTAAYLAGINVNKCKIKFFMIDGLLVGLAAAMYLSRLGSGLPSYGSGMEMDAMGAVVIGGTPISGGKGNIAGTLCGVLLIGLISNSLNMMHVNAFWQDIASGLLIILALAISALRTKLAARRQAMAEEE